MTMTVCLVGLGIGKTNGAYVGGHVNNVVNTAQHLGERGVEVHIVTTPPIHRERPVQSVTSLGNGVRLHTVQPGLGRTSETVSRKGKRSLLYGAVAFSKLLPAIRSLHAEFGFDILHGHSGYPSVATISTAAKALTGVPTVHTLYCPVPDRMVYRTAARAALAATDSIICVSENVRVSLPDLPVADISVVPPLVDTERFTPTATPPNTAPDPEESTASSAEHAAPDGSNRGRTGDGPQILYVGNFSEAKGLDVLVNAIAELRETYPSLRLAMAFDMPVSRYETADLAIKRRISRLGLDEHVVPLGIIDDLPAMMADSEVFVAPFRNTQGPADYPLSLLEAMASGLPVVTTGVGGIPEVVDDGRTGLLCAPDDPTELAAAIDTLLESSDRRETIGAAAASSVRELNEGMVSEVMAVYDQTVNGSEGTTGESTVQESRLADR